MKNLRTLLIAALFLSLIVPGANAAEKMGKIGYVNLRQLFDGYYKTKEYDDVLLEKQKKYESEGNEKVEKLKEAMGKLALLKEDKKADLESEIETMQTELKEYEQQVNADLSKDKNEMIREIMLEIEKVVSSYAEKEGYSVILNDTVLMYGAQNLNLTEQILELLNQNEPKK